MPAVRFFEVSLYTTALGGIPGRRSPRGGYPSKPKFAVDSGNEGPHDNIHRRVCYMWNHWRGRCHVSNIRRPRRVCGHPHVQTTWSSADRCALLTLHIQQKTKISEKTRKVGVYRRFSYHELIIVFTSKMGLNYAKKYL